MSVLSQLYVTMLELDQREKELNDLKAEYNDYRIIAESACKSKQVRDIKEHISWFDREDLKRKAKEVLNEEELENSLERARRQERIAKRRQREKKLREMEERAAERKALDELMEKERRNRARKNTEAN